MDIGRLLFSSSGRIGQREFWIGFLILFAGGVLVHAALLIGHLLWWLSTYCWVCLFSKRLHDMGHSGFAQAWIYIVDVVAVATALSLGLGSVLLALFSGHGYSMVLLMSALGWFILAFLLWSVIRLGFVLWLGLSAGQPGDNRYGPAVV